MIHLLNTSLPAGIATSLYSGKYDFRYNESRKIHTASWPADLKTFALTEYFHFYKVLNRISIINKINKLIVLFARLSEF